MGLASSRTPTGQERTHHRPHPDRTDDVLALARLAARRGPVRAILGWLSRRTGGVVTLVAADGSVLSAPYTPPTAPREDSTPRRTPVRTAPGERAEAGRPPGANGASAEGPPEGADATAAAIGAARSAAVTLHRRGAPSAVLGGTGTPTVHLVALDVAGGPVAGPALAAGTTGPAATVPYLAVVEPEDRHLSVLLADASRTLALCWRLEEAERDRGRVRSAEAHSREAVLHLLMIGSVPAAQRIAGALQPPLPALARVYVVECPRQRRPEIADRIERTARGRAWIVPCPVRPNHLIALVPPDTRAGRPERLDRMITRQVPECRVGVSAEVPLREAAAGYEQAFHALAVARNSPDRCAGYTRHTDIAALMSPEASAWAAELLEPCLRYAPPRRADPGPEELLGTLTSWLTFGGAASRHLKIHRNTLAARIRLLDELLGLTLGRRLADQTAAWLALRLHSAPYPPQSTADSRPATATLDGLLSTPAAAAWARAQLSPLEEAGPTAGQRTVQSWLRADARLPATARALGISLPGARKRLAKTEEALGRSLLHAPSAKYELWLAMRALDEL